MAGKDSTVVRSRRTGYADGFHQRLIEMLKVSGFETTDDQLKMLVTVTDKQPRTVANWLDRKTIPRPENINKILSGLSMWDAFGWLCLGDGHGPDPYAVKVVSAMQKMTEWERGKLVRMGLRLINQDPKVKRLLDLVDRGQIGRTEFFRLM